MNADSRHARIAIVGSGFGGLGMAIRLKQAGETDFVVFEKAHEVGGTWRDNTYPGCACDIESQLYSFSFAPNPTWSRMFSPQPEIQSYLEDCATRFAIRGKIRFSCEVLSAAWDDGQSVWRLETAAGEFTAKILISAMGPLSVPRYPDLPGLKTFSGNVFHSARWDHSCDLKGKRIAVIGTGASAIQFIPEVQKVAAHLTLFQRTPAWVLPRMDRGFSKQERARFARFPWILRWRRFLLFLMREAYGLPFWYPVLARWTRHMALRHMKEATPSEELRAKLTPSYEIGCKRVLMSNDYYPALTQGNVDVVTEAIREVRAHSIVTADGVERDVDAMLLGTGFQVTDMPQADRVKGRDGCTLGDVWRESPRAFLGTTVAGFPNLFTLLGPNTGLGHNSVVLMIEAQISHILAALKHMSRNGVATLEVKAAAQSTFNRDLARRSRGTVWVAGRCQSWYLDKTGYNSTLWPRSVVAFRRRLAGFKPRDFEMR